MPTNLMSMLLTFISFKYIYVVCYVYICLLQWFPGQNVSANMLIDEENTHFMVTLKGLNYQLKEGNYM